MNKYSVDQTTKEQRKKIVAEANVISDLSGTKLSESGRELLNCYVDGQLEIDQVQKMMIEKYTIIGEKLMNKPIINKVGCKKCGDIIESKHSHDFVRCKCGSIYVDGGQDYQRCGWLSGDMEDWIDFSYSVYEK